MYQIFNVLEFFQNPMASLVLKMQLSPNIIYREQFKHNVNFVFVEGAILPARKTWIQKTAPLEPSWWW